MRKTVIIRIVKVLSFLCVFCVIFSYVTFVLRNKNEADIVVPFYAEKRNSLDVVFIGSSHLMCAVYPVELYRDYGITSYVFASSAQLTPQSYYQLKEALRFQRPNLIVLDVSGVLYEQKVGSGEYAHVQFDNMRLSHVKIEAIWDLFEPAERLEYIFPLVRFHTRWKELDKTDFMRIESSTKGAYISTVVNEYAPNEYIPPEDKIPIYETAELYLRKCIELCKDRGIEVFLLNAPSSKSAEDMMRLNKVADIAEEYGIRYLNFIYLMDEIGFDTKTDYRDAWHCNASGAQKVTAYIGSHIKSHFDVPDRRGTAGYESWDDLRNCKVISCE